jgi:hypothetical protein
MNSEKTSKSSKIELRRLKKEINKIKKMEQEMKVVYQRYGKLQKNESNRNPGNMKFVKSNKIYS